MKFTLIAAVAAFTMIGITAHADSEGNGDPFPFSAPGVTTAAPAFFNAGSFATASPTTRLPPSQIGANRAIQETAEMPRLRKPVTVSNR